MEDDPISSSEEESPPQQPKPTPSTSAPKYRIPGPRKTVNTRHHTLYFGSLTTRKTKEELLATPRFTTSMKTKEQARRLLIEHELLPLNWQDSDHPSLGIALLHLEQSIYGLTAPGAEAICAVVLILNSLTPTSADITTPTATPRPTVSTSSQTTPLPIESSIQQETPHAVDLSEQITEIKAAIQDLRNVAATNETSANMLMNTVDLTRDELHNAAQVVTESANLLANGIDSPISSPPPSSDVTPPPPPSSPDHQNIAKALQEIKSLIRDRPPSTSSYKDALLKTNLPQHQTPNSPPPQEQARANAAIKEKQMLIDLDESHPIKKQCCSNNEMLTLFQTALSETKEDGSPELKIQSLKILKNGGILLEFDNKETVNWLKHDEHRKRFVNATGGKLNIKDRLFNIVVQFIPISTALEEDATLRNFEEDSKIPPNSIVSARWIKPINKRSPFQRFAHAIFSISSATVANHLIKQGIYINRENLRAHKDKKEPLRCLKCQNWGHVARTCKATNDTCGTCADNHRSSACPSEKPSFCVSCNSTDHPSSSRKCPEFIRRCNDLNARTPENVMPYFPTEEEWTQALLPPRSEGPIVQTRPPQTSNPTPKARKEIQTMIDRYTNSQRHLSQTNSTTARGSRPPTPSITTSPLQAPQSTSRDDVSWNEDSPSAPVPASPQEAPPLKFPSLSPLMTQRNPLPPASHQTTDDAPSSPISSL